LKALANKKLLGVAIGERSLMVAEVAGGERPQVKRLAEMVYPEGISLADPAALGTALSNFLKHNEFNSRSAVIGIPVKWIVVKTKEVPPTDAKTLAPLLRLQAEAEFSTELKDLVYDFISAPSDDATIKNVLLLATPRKYIQLVEDLCDTARLRPVAILPSALALGELTGSEPNKNVMVLDVTSAGSELTVQRGGAAGSIRHLRGAEVQPAFVSDLRRAVSTMSSAATTAREIVMWGGAGLDAGALGEQLGVSVRSPELSALGVDTSENGSNGDGSKYAAAVALAMLPMTDAGAPVDFLHSRLAPPKEQKIPRWAQIGGLAAIFVIALSIYAYSYLDGKQSEWQNVQKEVDSHQADSKKMDDFKSTVTFAQRWHGGDPRYLACMRDVIQAVPGNPNSADTYATFLEIKEAPRAVNSSTAGTSKADESRSLAGHVDARTLSQASVQAFWERLRANHSFSDVKIGATTFNARSREITFSISFTYTPGKN
jgi:hypothetical protein